MNSGIFSTTLTVLVSFLLSISSIVGANTDIVDVDNDLYPDANELGETELQKRRLSNFVRIGRGLSSFIRIGKNGMYAPYADLQGDADEFDDDSDYLKARYPEKRLSSFVRIGRPDPDLYQPLEKRAGAFIRVGKFPSSGYFRNRFTGNKSPYYRRTGRIGQSSFIRIGKRDTSNTLKNQIANDDLYNRYLELERKLADGSSDIKTEDKKMSSFVRIGRPSSFVRIGRPSSFVRIGRPSSFVRIGRPMGEEQTDNSEAPSGYVYDDNIKDTDQKRMSKFVRIGKNKELINDAVYKRRLSNFVRFGKRKDSNDFDNAMEFSDDMDRSMSSYEQDDKPHGIDIITEMKDENQKGLKDTQ